MRCMKNTKGSIGNTVEPRTPEKMRPGNGPLLGCRSTRTPHLRHLGEGFFTQRRVTATEIILMGQKEYYESQDRDNVEGAQSRSGHQHVRSYYDVIKHLPRKRGVMDEARHHVSMLENLDAVNGNMYYSEKDEFYVDEWSIQTPEIYHRHKELGTYFTRDGMDMYGERDIVTEAAMDNYITYIQWDAAGGLCGLCGVQMPGEILMMHKFYQF